MRNVIIDIISTLSIFFSFLTATAPATELTPAGVLSDIRTLGSRDVIEKLWNSDENHPNDWDRLIAKIETGEKNWLEVAVSLKPASDAGASEDLNGAVAVALLKNPIGVLTLTQQGPFDVSDICTSPYVVETPDEAVVADNHLKEAEKALLAVKVPTDNPRLDTVRQNCLAIIQGIRRGDYRKNREGRPPPNDWRSVLDRDTEFQALLNSIETGSNEALKRFKDMHPVTDPLKNGYLNLAVARALPNNPQGVLCLVADGYVGVADVCRSPYDEKGSSLKHLHRSERALREGTVPREDSMLETIRRNCLQEIRYSIESIEEH